MKTNPLSQDISEKLSLENLARSVPLFEAIKERSKTDGIYLVGGSLRNFILGRAVYDWDFVTDGNSKQIALDIARSTGSHFVPLDEEFGIYRVIPKEKNSQIDFTNIKGGSIEEDLRLRDFTINSIATDINTGELLDPSGGLEDIEKKIIRTANRQNIIDDSLRILRAYRMRALTGFEIDEETRSWITENAVLLEQTAYERIRDEIFKMLSCPHSAVIMQELYSDGVFPVILPELKPMEGLSQNMYHRYDVLRHSFAALEEFENLYNNPEPFWELSCVIKDYFDQQICGERKRLTAAKFAILLHDVGKPETRRVEGDKLYYTGHETAGKRIWNEISARFKLSNKEKQLGEIIIEQHLVPIFMALEKREDARKRQAYRFFLRTSDSAPAVIIASWADVDAGKGAALTSEMVENHHSFAKYLLQMYFQKDPLACPPVYLNGKDIITMLQTKGGSHVGRIMSDLREMCATGEINNYEEAIEYIKEIASEM